METPKVVLLTWSRYPLETVYTLWKSSKDDEPLMTPEEVHEKVPIEEIHRLFRAVIAQRIPIGESINFVFMLEGISVSLREQIVRHRIGVKPSLERVGSDIVMEDIPNLADSVWWSQSMRIKNMGKFAEHGDYRVPESIANHPDSESLLDTYHNTMDKIQEAYNLLVSSGVPMEDARELIPLGATHRMSWTLNISSLQHIIGKRSCWILQGGIWGPIIKGMIEELSEKVDPIFSDLATPPCIKNDEFKGCSFMEENARRYLGVDLLPPCPLHVRNHYLPMCGAKSEEINKAEHGSVLEKRRVPMIPQMLKRAEEYRAFWRRNPWTGEREGTG